MISSLKQGKHAKKPVKEDFFAGRLMDLSCEQYGLHDAARNGVAYDPGHLLLLPLILYQNEFDA